MADRLISSSVVSSESLSHLSDAAERLFWRIVASGNTDAWGRRDGSARRLRADCLPLLDWDDEKLIRSVEELVRHELGELYFVDGHCYFRVCNWDLYQRTTARLRRGRSRFPDPPAEEEDEDSISERPASDQRASGGRGRLISGSSSDVSQPSAAQSVQSGRAEFSETEEEQGVGTHSIGWFLAQVPGSSRRTAAAVATLQRKYRLPEAALHAALEEMRAGGNAIHNKPGLVVSKLKEYGESGRYAA